MIVVRECGQVPGTKMTVNHHGDQLTYRSVGNKEGIQSITKHTFHQMRAAQSL